METRNYLANAGGTPPEAPASPSNGYPQSAVPGVNEATTLGPHWFYKVGEELRAIITAAGLTPSDASLGQVLAALQGGFGLGKSLTSNGYLILPGGLIIQWGTSLNGTPPISVTFPLAFPTVALVAFLADKGAANESPYAVNTLSTTGLTINCATGANMCWLAIGY